MLIVQYIQYLAKNKKKKTIKMKRFFEYLIRKLEINIFSPTSDGAAAAILCSEQFLNKSPHLSKQAVEIIGNNSILWIRIYK